MEVKGILSVFSVLGGRPWSVLLKGRSTMLMFKLRVWIWQRRLAALRGVVRREMVKGVREERRWARWRKGRRWP